MDHPEKGPRSGRETALALVLTLLFGGGFLMFLILVSGGFFFYVLLAVGCIGFVGMLHYFLWGQALTQEVAGEREEAEFRDRLQSEDDEPPQHQDRVRRF